MPTLSVIIPAYNESNTIEQVLTSVLGATLPPDYDREIVIVNDGSEDDTEQKILSFMNAHRQIPIIYLPQEHNQGKGAAMHAGIEAAKGDYIIVQDADLEYNPEDYARLLEPVIQNQADVVYGSRFVGGRPHRVLFFWHSIGNKLLTGLSNAFTNLNLTDMETGYKLFRAKYLKQLKLREKSFGFEPEVTAKISKIEGIRIYEVGISYYGRTYADGKKINWRDGFWAIYCILRYNLLS